MSFCVFLLLTELPENKYFGVCIRQIADLYFLMSVTRKLSFSFSFLPSFLLAFLLSFWWCHVSMIFWPCFLTLALSSSHLRSSCLLQSLLTVFRKDLPSISPVRHSGAFWDLPYYGCVCSTLLIPSCGGIFKSVYLQSRIGCWESLVCFLHSCRFKLAFCVCSLTVCKGPLWMLLEIHTWNWPWGGGMCGQSMWTAGVPVDHIREKIWHTQLPMLVMDE